MRHFQRTSELQRALDDLARHGVRADVDALKADMSSQFANPHEWIREYVANAADANARRVVVAAAEQRDRVTVSVADDGDGMGRDSVTAFFTVFSSLKQTRDGREAVGRHGVGKLSVAAAPGQRTFAMRTSTGSEAWQASLGRLLDAGPIRIEPVSPPPPKGTVFELTFDRTESAAVLLARLEAVLLRATRFLPVEIELRGAGEPTLLGAEPWTAGRAARRYRFDVAGCRCDAVLSLDSPATHELYQSRVLVSDRYDLWTHEVKQRLALPHVAVRVDSTEFELPFGRHALMNETVVAPLAEHLQREVLPDYVATLLALPPDEIGSPTRAEIEDIAAALLGHGACWEPVLERVPLFLDVRGRRLSLAQLRSSAHGRGAVYVESVLRAGSGSECLDASVLIDRQPLGALAALERALPGHVVRLDEDDVAIEAAPSVSPIGPRELRFASQLRYRRPPPIARRMNGKHPTEGGASSGGAGDREPGASPEDVLLEIEWRVAHLVGRDGRTPCLTRRFVSRGKTVVLNLHHPDVIDLVLLAERAPSLAGHFGLALVITDPGFLGLRHLPPVAREQLLLHDAVAKAFDSVAPPTDEAEADPVKYPEYDDLLRAFETLARGRDEAPPTVPEWTLRRRPGSA